MNITIIIPTLNEAQFIGRLIDRLLTADSNNLEIIVVDGGSEDDTVRIVESRGIKVLYCDCSRAKQMNTGAKAASHDYLYFVHADTLPPEGYLDDWKDMLGKGFDAACYRSEFESRNPMLRLNEFFTRFYWLVARGGDQSLFIKKDVFEDLGMFCEKMEIMEEYPVIEKLMGSKKIGLIPKPILISTRKYDERSWLKVSRANYAAFKLFKKGADSKTIKERYKELLG